jgi:uncharacterized protein (TIGR00730 family)
VPDDQPTASEPAIPESAIPERAIPDQDIPDPATAERGAAGSLPATRDEELLAAAGPALDVLCSGDPERVARIADELTMGFDAMAGVTKAVSIFGSARTPDGAPAYDLARRTAAAFGEAGFSVITGGGGGIMAAANRGARDVGAHSIGLNIELPHEQAANPYLDVHLEFEHFFVRKVMFVRYASAFVVMPGGIGTLDEMYEARVLIQTAKIRHFPLVMMGSMFWSGLLAWERATLLADGLVDAADVDGVHVLDEPGHVVELVERAYQRQAAATTDRVGALLAAAARPGGLDPAGSAGALSDPGAPTGAAGAPR